MPSTWCPQCGPRVAVDEDGYCESCGATAMGEGVEYAVQMESAFIALVAAVRAIVDADTGRAMEQLALSAAGVHSGAVYLGQLDLRAVLARAQMILAPCYAPRNLPPVPPTSSVPDGEEK